MDHLIATNRLLKNIIENGIRRYAANIGRESFPFEVEVDPVEVIKIRMEDFGYKPADLAQVYGDKGTVSKVLNYKQALSLSMIRKFSQLLRIPAELLIREYSLKGVQEP